MRKPSPPRGMTLIELLICVSILAIVVNTSLPGVSRMLRKNQVVTSINALNRAINVARSSAVSSGKMVTLCKSQDGVQCGGDWTQGVIVFTDQNADRQVNEEDKIVQIIPAFNSLGSLKFRAFQNKQYLQMTPMGFTNYQNGNFTFCPDNNDNSLAQQLIISRSGRTRFAQDNDGDGIRETASGDPIICS